MTVFSLSFWGGAALCATVIVGDRANAAVYNLRLTDDQRTFDYEATAGDTTAPSQGVSNDLRIGTTLAGARQASTILPFALPALDPNEQIVSAFLTINSVAQSAANVPVTPNADLYGLPTDPAAGGVDVTSTRHYTGPLDPAASPTGTTRLLQDNFLTPSLAPTSGSDVPVTSVNLAGFITSLYEGGAAAGDFAVLRLSYESTDTAEARRYRIRSAGGTTAAANSDTRPLLVINTQVVPEPGSAAIVGAASIGLLAARRRRR